jgi:molybdopterin-guanine dinucleotide biosynthesis protein A
MGQDKALIRLAGRPLIEHVLESVAGIGDETLITTNHPDALAYLGVRMVGDALPGKGSLAGLYTALNAASGDRVLVVACDMPFLTRPLLRHLVQLSHLADVIIPKRGGEFEPFLAVYNRSCLAAIKEALESQKARMISFFDQVTLRTVKGSEIAQLDPQGLSFFNINTPEDLAQAEELFLELRRNLDEAPPHESL